MPWKLPDPDKETMDYITQCVEHNGKALDSILEGFRESHPARKNIIRVLTDLMDRLPDPLCMNNVADWQVKALAAEITICYAPSLAPQMYMILIWPTGRSIFHCLIWADLAKPLHPDKLNMDTYQLSAWRKPNIILNDLDPEDSMDMTGFMSVVINTLNIMRDPSLMNAP